MFTERKKKIKELHCVLQSALLLCLIPSWYLHIIPLVF